MRGWRGPNGKANYLSRRSPSRLEVFHLAPRTPPRTLLLVILTAVMVVSGCISSDDGTIKVGDLRTEDTFVEIGEADAVEVNLDIGQGNLRVRTGGDELMEAIIKYNVDQWKPRFTYVEQGEIWNLTVRQPGQDLDVEGDARNDWDLRFGLVVPMAINVEMGVGNADIQVGGLDLVSLSVSTGAGEVDLDLSGTWYDHLLVRVGTGAGDVGLIVPSGIGVQISVIQGAGTVIAPGFTQVEGNYKNAAFDTAQVLMLFAVDIGAGNLKVLQVP